MTPAKSAESLSFDPDRADLDAAPYNAPIVFDHMRVPCQCGGTLLGRQYEFFANTLFIHGECRKCGPRRAIFAPPAEQLSQATLDRHLDEREAKALDEFLDYLAYAERKADESAA